MNRLALLPLLFAGSTAEARKKSGANVVVAEVPSIEEVVREEGFTPTPSQSEIYRPGAVLVPNGRGGHDVVVESCVDTEPSISIMSQSSIATTLAGGVSARLGMARGAASAGVEKRLSFVDPEQRTISLGRVEATQDCREQVRIAERLRDLSNAIILHDVLVAIIQNTVCTRADASGGVVALGAAEAAAYSECVQESNGQVPLGYKAVPLQRVVGSAAAAPDSVRASSSNPQSANDSGVFKIFQSLCDGGSAIGCTNLGMSYEKGEGVGQDLRRAAELYQRACDEGDPRGCISLGFAYSDGKGVPEDSRQAAVLFAKACDLGEIEACTILAGHYSLGLGIEQDDERAVELLREACDAGSAMGCTSLGLHYERGLGVVTDIRRAASLYRMGCEAGHEEGCELQSAISNTVVSIPAADPLSSNQFTELCDSGDAEACGVVGMMYKQRYEEEGSQSDLRQAAARFEKACSGGVLPVYCARMGFMYSRGEGVPVDLRKAARLWGLGCDGGLAVPCDALGLAFIKGEGVTKDVERAVELWRKSCDLGSDTGCQAIQQLQ